MTNLATHLCVPCRGGEPPLTEAEIDALLPQVSNWQVKEVDGIKQLERIFKFKGFMPALEFTNRVGAIAEAEGHHPLIVTEWGRVTIQWWTHKIRGLHKNDFIMAAKTDEAVGMSNVPPADSSTNPRRQWVVTKTTLGEQKSDFAYWQTQPYAARIAALEEIRREYHQWRYHAEPRFQRVFSILKRK